MTKPVTNWNSRMAFHAHTGRIVLFPGVASAAANETWLWDGTNWTQASPAAAPPGRTGHAMTYDEQRRQVVLFGGFDAAGNPLNDTWVWDGTNWTRKSPPLSPSPRREHAMAYDPVRQQTILFGGWDGNVNSAETWGWDGTTWTKLSPAVAPGARSGAHLAWDAAQQALVLLAGPSLSSPDLWTWNGNTWTDRTTAASGLSFVRGITSHKGKILAIVSEIPEAQSFTLTGNSWQLLAASPSTPVTDTTAYDSLRDRTIGITGSGAGESTTWSFDYGGGCTHTGRRGNSTLDMPGGGGTLSIQIDLAAGCGWSARTLYPWLSANPASGSGPGTVTLTAPANPTASQQANFVSVSGKSWLLLQAVAPCQVSGPLPPSPFVVQNSCASTYSYTAAAGEQIAFLAVGRSLGETSAPAMTIWNPGRTTALMQASAPPNAGRAALLPAQGTFTFPSAGTYLIEVSADGAATGGSTVFYVKAGSGCTPTVTTYSTSGLMNYPLSFSAGEVMPSSAWLYLGVAPGCASVPVVSTASWLKAGPASAPPGFTPLHIAPQLNYGEERTANITVGATSIPVNQRASPCQFSLSRNSTTVDSNRTAGELILTLTPPFCSSPWTASSDASWLQVYPLAGSTTSTVQYTIFPNFGLKARTATLTIAGRTFQVTQGPTSGTSMERFVRLLYFNFFGRLPTAAEVAHHVNSGQSREQLALNFFNSKEFTNGGRFVAGLYVGLLNRDAEYGGWLFQRDALVNGINTHDPLIRNFLGSEEFNLKHIYLFDASFVTLLYRQVLLREPTQAEVNSQVAVLTTGTPRSVLALGFLTSDEFVIGTGPRLIAFLAYAGLLNRDPTPAEFTAARAQTVANLLSGIVSSAEFNAILQ